MSNKRRLMSLLFKNGYRFAEALSNFSTLEGKSLSLEVEKTTFISPDNRQIVNPEFYDIHGVFDRLNIDLSIRNSGQIDHASKKNRSYNIIMEMYVYKSDGYYIVLEFTANIHDLVLEVFDAYNIDISNFKRNSFYKT